MSDILTIKTLPGRLELPTLRLTASRSNQLSYGSPEGRYEQKANAQEKARNTGICKVLFSLVSECVLEKNERYSHEKDAPREARTPDLEVNGLTL